MQAGRLHQITEQADRIERDPAEVYELMTRMQHAELESTAEAVWPSPLANWPAKHGRADRRHGHPGG